MASNYKYGGKTTTEKTVNVGKIGVRERDETGHRTGVGTLARKMAKEPKKTIRAANEFKKSYTKMRQANEIGGNLAAHREANHEATRKSDAQTAAAFSAMREQYKRVRVKKNPDGNWHIGDTRSKQETTATMNANRLGREDAKKR